MKNFLSYDNLVLGEKDSISNIIKSSSQVSDCSITNVLEDNSSSIWISSEELPQEITINLSRSFLKEFPKKLTAIGIYCWHAYPTNPKLVEILISKNDENNFISFGNFDLCLKPGRQLLQLDEENDINLLNTENNNYIIKIIIKETFGDKRTYINNIYLYEKIDFCSLGKYNNVNTIETIKEEEDSSSVFFLRESRERTLPRKKNNSKGNNTKINNNQNISIKVNDKLYNKDLTIDEFEIITKSKDNKVQDNKLKDKITDSKNNLNDLIINNTYDNDESNIHLNNNLFGTDTQFNGTYSEISEKNKNTLKPDESTNKNILLTKINDNIDEQLNNSNKNLSNNKLEEEIEKNEEKKSKNTKNHEKNGESFDASLSSGDLEPYEILKGTKTHQKNFFKPPKNVELNDELENIEFQHSTSDFKTKNDIFNKKLSENYFNMQNSNNKSSKNKINKKINIDKSNINNNNEEINKFKEELNIIKNEFQNYKKEQEEKNMRYENKILLLQSHIKKLQINSNKMNDVVKTLLEAQYIQNQTNNDYLLGQMKKIASETFVNIFSNITQLANLAQNPSSPTITIQNPNQSRQTLMSYNDNGTNINYNDERQNQQTYQTKSRKKYSIDKINRQQNNYSINDNINNNINNNIIMNDNVNNAMNTVYNKKINDNLNMKANKLKKYNSGRNIVLKKNYMNQNLNNYINYNNQNSFNNNETIENTDNNEEELKNDNLFYQAGYPTETNKTQFQRFSNININPNEILRINNNNYNTNISLNDKKEIIHKRIISNTYKKKTFSPTKRIKHSYIIYSDTNHLYPETTVNSSNQNKNINFNFNLNDNFKENENEEKEQNENGENCENEENEEEEEASNNEDAPLKVSQLKTEKRNYNFDKLLKNKKDNYDEEKDNGNENDTKINSVVGDTYTNFRKKLGEKLNDEIVKSCMNKKGKYSMGNIEIIDEISNINREDKIINKKKITVKNESLIRLIHQFNNKKKKEEKEINNE